VVKMSSLSTLSSTDHLLLVVLLVIYYLS
jgi:hypothetical protein